MAKQGLAAEPEQRAIRIHVSMTLVSVFVLAGVVVWLISSGDEEPASRSLRQLHTSGVTSHSETAIPMGGLAEQYRDIEQAQAAREANQIVSQGGLGELYAEQAVASHTTNELQLDLR